MTDKLTENIKRGLFGKWNRSRLADIAALIEPLRDDHYLIRGENGTLRSEIGRLTDELAALRGGSDGR